MIADPHDITSGTKLFTTPRNAAALVADFKRRAVDGIRNAPKDLGFEERDYWARFVESLPLIDQDMKGE